MPNPTPQPVIRCPHRDVCGEKTILCKAFDPAVKTEVLRAGLCPEVRGKRHVAETVELFERAEAEIKTHFEVQGDESDGQD